jgi:hypothetical protein
MQSMRTAVMAEHVPHMTASRQNELHESHFANRHQESVDMKRFAIACAAGAFALTCASAFAQDNPPSSNTGLQAGDNAQTTTQGPGTHSSKSSHKKMHSSKSTLNSGPSTAPNGTATPSGPGAPVSASGSGQ